MLEREPIPSQEKSEKPTSGSEVNFHEVARERAALRRMKREAGPETADIIAEELDELNKKAVEFSRTLQGEGLAKTKELLKVQKESYEKTKWINEPAIAEEVGPTYSLLAEAETKLAEVQDFEMSQLRRGATNPDVSNLNKRILPKIREKRERLEDGVSQVEEQNPSAFRAYELVSYKKGLHAEGHIAPVPSVKKYREEIGSRMITGKPMFLHGPTGTGKTSLARDAAEHFTGGRAEMVYCNPQTRESNIWGKTGIRPAEGGAIETVDIYGPLARAMRDGRVVIFDEFTSLPREQMDMIKAMFGYKPGDTASVVGNGEVKIVPGFQMIFTANLHGEKHPEKQPLPDQIAREFEQNNLEVNYTPEDEAYDIMLARLMNPDGSVDFSWHDVTETLPKLAKAMAEIQIAYTGELSADTARTTQTMDVSGKRPGLRKFVMTQGTIENILDGWKIETQTNSNPPSFVEFLDKRLKTGLTFKEYPAADRTLAAKILSSMGFLRTLTPQGLGLSQDVFAFSAAKSLREGKTEELIQKSKAISRITLTELADLDPWKKRERKAAEAAREFLPEEERGERAEKSPEELRKELKNFLTETFSSWGIDKQKAEQAADHVPELIIPEDQGWQSRKQDVEVSKFGEYTLNPETVGIDWETIPPEKIIIKELHDLNGKPLANIAEYIITTYGATHDIPGIEYWKYILENPDKAPALLKDGNYHFFFGSILRGADGGWIVPYARWDAADAEWYRGAGWLENDWDGNYRVVLLEK